MPTHCIILYFYIYLLVFFFKQKTAYEVRISDWSSDVCSSDLALALPGTRMADDLVQRLHGAGLILLGLLNIGPIGLARIPRRSINARAHVFRGHVERGRILNRLQAFDDRRETGIRLFQRRGVVGDFEDRTGVGEGKGGSVRGDFGG